MPALPRAFSITPHAITDAYDRACARLDSVGFAAALQRRQLDVWSSDLATQKLVANRLGWLSATSFVTPLVPRLKAFAEAVKKDGFTDVLLLGMGGSSLAPEVLRQVFPSTSSPRFAVLDSVDPDAVRTAMARARDTLFVLASKSGSTIEPNVMAAEARRRVTAEGHTNWGSRFVAITDEDTQLHRRAVADGFRDVFVNPSDIGGRYSALSLFGLVPAALMGLDLDALLAGAQAMEEACRTETTRDNPGLALGALMGAGALAGRDKLTLRVPPRLHSFGLWVEQLVAESTGKHGKGVVPITGEADDVTLGDDRVVVSVTAGSDAPPPLDGELPSATLQMSGYDALGAEFFRWEVATAAAGLLLEINPFDEPNVQQAKDATRVLLGLYEQQHRLPLPEAHGISEGTRLTLSEPAVASLNGQPAQAFLQVVRSHDYVGLLVYLPSDQADWEAALQEFRTAITASTGCAATVGYGPRYLHSTGQLHKGGASNGVFVIVTAPPKEDLPVPGETFSFGVLESAQALGDFQSLERTGRRALFVQLPHRGVEAFTQVADTLMGSIAATGAR